VRPEKRWYVENGDRVTGPELPGHRRQIHAERRALRNDDEVGETDQIERPDQRPEEEAHAHREQREDCEQRSPASGVLSPAVPSPVKLFFASS
jgi:hypothetical protein